MTDKKKFQTRKKDSYLNLALVILKKEGGPLSIDDIFLGVSKMRKMTGKTPQQTLSSALQRCPLVKRIKIGVYTLSD